MSNRVQCLVLFCYCSIPTLWVGSYPHTEFPATATTAKLMTLCPSNAHVSARISACQPANLSWMAAYQLKLNLSKIQLMYSRGSTHYDSTRQHSDLTICPAPAYCTSLVYKITSYFLFFLSHVANSIQLTDIDFSFGTQGELEYLCLFTSLLF